MEEVIGSDLEIVDSHHHLWDHRRPHYLLDDFVGDAKSGHNIVESIFVECRWAWDRTLPPQLMPKGEVARVTELSTASEQTGSGLLNGIVGFVDLGCGAQIGDALDALIECGGGKLVGIRNRTNYSDDPALSESVSGAPPEVTRSIMWRQGFRQLVSRGLPFDAWVYHTQLAEVRDLARTFPAATIIVNHLGGPIGVGRYADRQDSVLTDWRRDLAEISKLPNVYMKLGGIGMRTLGGDWLARNRPISSSTLAAHWKSRIRLCIDLFGPQRCMFESNFPVDREYVSYRNLWNAFKRITEEDSDFDKFHLYAGTARSAYRLPSTARSPAAHP